MTNPLIAIKKYFISTLGPATSLTVYDGIAPDTAGSEYIVLTGRTGQQLQGKTGFVNNCSVTVECITRGQSTGYKRAEAIGQLVLTAINSDTDITLATGQATSLFVESIRNIDGLNSTDNVFRQIITYNVIIS